MTEYARRSARVIVVDARERVLLWHARWDTGRPELGVGWFTPGGGAEPGETPAETAARELAEETGLVVAPEALGERVAWCEGYAELSFGSGTFRDDFFLLRVDGLDVSTDGHQEVESAHIVGHRWWTIDELAETDEVVVPRGLAPLLRDVLASGPPAEPVRLPWRW